MSGVDWETLAASPIANWNGEEADFPSGFLGMVTEDNKSVFLNAEEFGAKRTIRYDGETYEDIPVVLNGNRQNPRQPPRPEQDHARGLYAAVQLLHCRLSDLGGIRPKQDDPIEITSEPGGTFFRKFYVVSSNVELGMLKLELATTDE